MYRSPLLGAGTSLDPSKVDENLWDQKKEFAKGNSPETLKLNEDLGEIGINTSIPFLVGISKGRSGNRLTEARVVQLAGESSQAVLNITKAFPACQLSKTHDKKVFPASKFSYSVVAIIIIDTFLELIFWHKCH